MYEPLHIYWFCHVIAKMLSHSIVPGSKLAGRSVCRFWYCCPWCHGQLTSTKLLINHQLSRHGGVIKELQLGKNDTNKPETASSVNGKFYSTTFYPACIVWPPLPSQQKTIRVAFSWNTDNGPL